MAVGPGPLAPSGLDLSAAPLPIPDAGLAEVLSSWSGHGDLIEAVAAAAGDTLSDREWSVAEVRRRANRILLQELSLSLAGWPRTINAWLDALPAESVRRRRMDVAVGPGVDWIN